MTDTPADRITARLARLPDADGLMIERTELEALLAELAEAKHPDGPYIGGFLAGRRAAEAATESAEAERDRLERENADLADFAELGERRRELQAERDRAVARWHDEHKRAEAAEAERDHWRKLLDDALAVNGTSLEEMAAADPDIPTPRTIAIGRLTRDRLTAWLDGALDARMPSAVGACGHPFDVLTAAGCIVCGPQTASEPPGAPESDPAAVGDGNEPGGATVHDSAPRMSQDGLAPVPYGPWMLATDGHRDGLDGPQRAAGAPDAAPALKRSTETVLGAQRPAEGPATD